MSGAASFLNGLTDSVHMARDQQYRERELDMYENMMHQRRSMGPASNGSTSHGGASPVATYGKGTISTDPVATDLPNYARAFLNSVSHGESGGAYDVRYSPNGAVTFDVSAGVHPRIFEDGPHGKSSAAGRYQHTATTWDDTGGGAFTPYNQDHRAWGLAQDRYRAVTGGDLSAVLQSDGLTSGVMDALAPTWAAFGNSGKHGAYIGTYNSSMDRYRAATPAPAGTPPFVAPERRSMGEMISDGVERVRANVADLKEAASSPQRRSFAPHAAQTWGWVKEIAGGGA